MRSAGGMLAALAAFGFAAGHVTAWLLYRRRLGELSESMQARLAHRSAESKREFAVVHDALLQDVQGLALSLHAVADQLAPETSARRQLEQVLDRTDELLAAGRRRVRGGGERNDGFD